MPLRASIYTCRAGSLPLAAGLPFRYTPLAVASELSFAGAVTARWRLFALGGGRQIPFRGFDSFVELAINGSLFELLDLISGYVEPPEDVYSL